MPQISERPAPVKFSPGASLLQPPDGGLYSWTVVTRDGPRPGLGAVGVSSDHERAIRELAKALRSAPHGAFGLLHEVSGFLDGGGYLYGRLLAKARVDPATNAVVMIDDDIGAPQGPVDVFTEIARHTTGRRPA